MTHDEPKLEESTAADLYVVCPRCKGERTISACTRPADDWSERPSQWEDFNCPACSGVGTTARDNAIQVKRELAEQWAWDQGTELVEGISDEDIAKAVKYEDLPTEDG